MIFFPLLDAFVEHTSRLACVAREAGARLCFVAV